MSLSILARDSAQPYRSRVVVPLPRRVSPPAPGWPPPTVDIVVPVHNGEQHLAAAVRRLHAFLRQRFPFSARITIADSASTDGTAAIAQRLAAELPGIRVLRLNEKGRGRALAAAWLTSEARIVAHLAVDLDADLSGLPALIAPVVSGHSEVSVGRGRRADLISRAYSRLLRTVLRVHFREAHRGFEAMRADVARRLVPEVVDRGRFFETELLIRAERAGLRIHELPVNRTGDEPRPASPPGSPVLRSLRP